MKTFKAILLGILIAIISLFVGGIGVVALAFDCSFVEAIGIAIIILIIVICLKKS